MKAYYRKELPDQPLYLLGKAYRFELMETSDQQLIQLLDACARQHKGGIIKITEQEYLDKKKAKELAPSLPKQYKREEIRQKVVSQSRRFVNRNRNENAVVSAKTAETPTEAVLNQGVQAYIPKTASGLLS